MTEPDTECVNAPPGVSALSEALRLASLGYKVFPCLPGEKRPATRHGCHDASNDPEQIKRWFGNGQRYNLALDCTDLLVIDVDDPNGTWLAENAERLHPAAEAKTPRGGRHLFFKRPPGHAWGLSAGRIAPKVDIRTTGGYVLVYPSRTKDGEYAWDPTIANTFDDLTLTHDWITSLLDSMKPATQAPMSPPAPPVAAPSSSEYSRALAYVKAVPPQPEGARNDALNALAYRLMERFHLTENEHMDLCQAWAAMCSPPMSPHEAGRTIQSAWRGAQNKNAVGAKRTETSAPSPPSPAPAPRDDPQPEPRKLDVYEFDDLMQHDWKDPGERLLGDGFLCKGGSLLWVGRTGLGKSSALFQAACCWAAGRDFFGIAPQRPLKIVMLQAENDKNDCAEMLQGVMKGCDIPATEIAHKPIVIREASTVGLDAIQLLRYLAEYYQPDIIILDPFFSYAGCDVSDQKAVSAFLRTGLGRIQQETNVAFIIAHHTNKPPGDPTTNSGWTATDSAYMGSGSNELANWPRGVLVLTATKDENQDGSSVFVLSAPKRGKRSGLCGPDRTPVRQGKPIFLRHSDHLICWQYAESPFDRQTREDERAAMDTLAKIPEGDYSHSELVKAILAANGWNARSNLGKDRPGGRILQRLEGILSNPNFPGKYTVVHSVHSCSQ